MIKKINKKKLIIVLTIVGLVILLFYNYFRSSQEEKTTTTKTPNLVDFKLVKSIPKEGNVNIFETSAIEFYFTRPASEVLTEVSIVPDISYKVASNSQFNSLYIKPLPEWEIETEYTINLKAVSLDGASTINNIEYRFKIEPIKDSLLSE